MNTPLTPLCLIPDPENIFAGVSEPNRELKPSKPSQKQHGFPMRRQGQHLQSADGKTQYVDTGKGWRRVRD